MSYLGVPPFGQTVRTITESLATAGQTTFSPSGGYLPGYIDVFLNGSALGAADFTATNGSTVVLNVAAALNDEFKAIAYWPVSLIDTYRKAEADALLAARVGTTSSVSMRNRIINGDMRIDQRNAGASVTVTTGVGYIYPVDRFGSYNNSGVNYTAQRVTDAPVGFTNSVRLTFGSAISLTSQNEATFFQIVEGFNVADLGWGTANATAITVGLWVKASFTGVNSIGFCNHNGTRAYATTYTINAANTWEFKTFVIPGDTAGAWLTDNSAGLFVRFNIAAGSNFQVSSNNAWATRAGAYNAADGAYGTKAVGAPSAVSAGATWQVTGVQLEAGTVATPFERRDYGRELMMCMRYYERRTVGSNFNERLTTTGLANGSSSAQFPVQHLVQKRASPSSINVVNLSSTSTYDGTGAGTPTSWNLDNTGVFVTNISVSGITTSLGRAIHWTWLNITPLPYIEINSEL